MTPSAVLGLDFGTGSVRALVVDAADGRELACAVTPFGRGVDGVLLSDADADLARQHPADHLTALTDAVRRAMTEAAVPIAGIGVDTTGSTPLPVDENCQPLALHPDLTDDLAAMAWLWKDHTSQTEALEITARAADVLPDALARCGGAYSSEWFWAKILRCARTAPAVFDRAASWLEMCDWIPAWLTGTTNLGGVARSRCAAGHKALFGAEWGGLPDAAFFEGLAPGLGELRQQLYDVTATSDQSAGRLADEPAGQLGLEPGIPVAVGAFDAHLGAVGAGVQPGELVKVIGTSSCDMAVAELRNPANVRAPSCGVVDGSIVPGLYGFEAGQAAVGDIFAWCARNVGASDHEGLTAAAQRLRPGESGLLALDWHNGNRSILVDPALSGVLIGLNLHTTAAEIYRAMIEATAFGSRIIVETLGAAGVGAERVVACGGIAHRSSLLLQIYADVHNRPVEVVASEQTCALGAAIMGAVVSGLHTNVPAAQEAMCPPRGTTVAPNPSAAATYEELFAHYRALHDTFGHDRRSPAHEAMKGVLAIAKRGSSS